jgi:hypothetical protein
VSDCAEGKTPAADKDKDKDKAAGPKPANGL